MKGAMVKVTVPDVTRRSWRTLWRKRPCERVLFAGFITGGELNRRMNAPDTLNITAKDATATLYERTI